MTDLLPRAAIVVVDDDPGDRATLSHYLVTQIEAHPAIAVRTRTEVAEAHGKGVLAGLTLRDTAAPYETAVPGVYAVGDVRSRSLKRVAAAVGEGSGCIALVHDYLAGR